MTMCVYMCVAACSNSALPSCSAERGHQQHLVLCAQALCRPSVQQLLSVSRAQPHLLHCVRAHQQVYSKQCVRCVSRQLLTVNWILANTHLSTIGVASVVLRSSCNTDH
jgi:hypothetical protein